MSDDIRDMLRANFAAPGDEPAVAWRGAWYGWSWMRRVHAALGAALDGAGLGEGAPIGLISRNRPQHVAAALSILAQGKTACMIYGAQTPAGLANEIATLRPPAVVADEADWAGPVEAAVREIGALGVAISADPEQPVRIVTRPERLDPAAFKPADPEVAVELLSSGTTGRPKRIPLRWDTVSASVQDGKAVYAAGPAGQEGDAPAIMVHPLGNISGLAYAITPLAFRRRVVLLEKFDLNAWLDAVRTYRPRRSALPPVAIRMIVEAGIPKADLASLAVIGCGGSALPADVQDAFEATYGIPILSALGATEFGGVVANWTADDHRAFGRRKRGSVGRARPGVELRVVHPETLEPLPTGEVGLLEARVDRLGPDWIRTTDLASLDADGFLYLHGRADSAINRGGFKVVPEVVASALAQHPAVGEVVVVGLPDARLGQVPAAAVELKPGAPAPSEAELIAFAKDRLIAYQVPVRILPMAALPRNVSMKASLPEIVQMLSEGREAVA